MVEGFLWPEGVGWRGGGPFCALGLRGVLRPLPRSWGPGRHPFQVPPRASLRAGRVGWEIREASAQTVEAGRAQGGGASGLGESGGAGGAPGGRAGLFGPAVHATAPRVHEEIADGIELQAELLRDGDLHFFGRPLVLLEDGDQRATLQVSEHQALLLWLQCALLLLLLLLPLAGCRPVARRRASGDSATTRPGRRKQHRKEHSAERHQRSRNRRSTEGRRDNSGQGQKRQGDTEMSVGRHGRDHGAARRWER